MNLTKYFMIELPMDDTLRADRHAVDLEPEEVRSREGMTHELGWRQPRRVFGDHRLGARVCSAPRRKNNEEFLGEVKWLQDYLSAKPPPKYPFPIDAGAGAGRQGGVRRECAGCHASERTGTRMPLAGVGTDREPHARPGTRTHAIAANKVVSELRASSARGWSRRRSTATTPPFLDGIWLRAPYLHNGSVPTLRDLLKPPAERPKVFWRGYDVYDPVNVGFVTHGDRGRARGHEATTCASARTATRGTRSGRRCRQARRMRWSST